MPNMWDHDHPVTKLHNEIITVAEMARKVLNSKEKERGITEDVFIKIHLFKLCFKLKVQRPYKKAEGIFIRIVKNKK